MIAALPQKLTFLYIPNEAFFTYRLCIVLFSDDIILKKVLLITTILTLFALFVSNFFNSGRIAFVVFYPRVAGLNFFAPHAVVCKSNSCPHENKIK